MFSFTCPPSMRVMSSRLLMILVTRAASCRMDSSNGFPSSDFSSVSAAPVMAASGLRRSWETELSSTFLIFSFSATIFRGLRRLRRFRARQRRAQQADEGFHHHLLVGQQAVVVDRYRAERAVQPLDGQFQPLCCRGGLAENGPVGIADAGLRLHSLENGLDEAFAHGFARVGGGQFLHELIQHQGFMLAPPWRAAPGRAGARQRRNHETRREHDEEGQ